jgi:hypothetical protein
MADDEERGGPEALDEFESLVVDAIDRLPAEFQ